MKSHVAKKLIAGFLMFVPMFFVGFAVFQVIDLGRVLLTPIVDFFGLKDWLEIALLNVLAILGLFALFYGLGWLYLVGFVSDKVDRLDRALTYVIPGYAVAKGIIGGVVQDEELLENLRPVMADIGPVTRVGFEIERTDGGQVVVYLPNAPNASGGVVVSVDAGRVTPVKAPPHRIVEAVNFYGQGLSGVMDGADDTADQGQLMPEVRSRQPS